MILSVCRGVACPHRDCFVATLLAKTERENVSHRQKEGKCLAMIEKESYYEYLKGAGQSPWLNSKHQNPNSKPTPSKCKNKSAK
jgi:hypothetical protein